MKTKEKILVNALEIILEKGFHGTSMRDIAEKCGIAPSGIYNHFKEKDEIFTAVLFKFHPWVIIPKIVQTVKATNFEDFVKESSEKELKELKKNENILKLHFIELVEFNGTHLAILFEKAFTEMLLVLNEKEKQTPELFTKQSIPQLSRALLGLFFSYMISNPMVMGKVNTNLSIDDFSYFNDIYLQGFISNDDQKELQMEQK